ncbi:MAG: radical SAM protein, partial [Candidatus Paceibacterota bacterium]
PPKLISADDPKSPLFLTREDLARLPWPDRELIDIGSYHYRIEGEEALSLVSQLGCPFGCGFCGGRHAPSFRRMRSRPIGSILAEIEQLHQTYGVKGFMFFDDELNVSPMFPKLLRGIIGLQERLGAEFRLRGFVKSQLFTNEQAGLMYEAGFRWILAGFESGSDRMLQNMSKRSTAEENTRCVEIARAHQLKVKALMSIGHPGESSATIQATQKWLLENGVDDFDATIVTVYPGTSYHDEAVPDPTRAGVWVYTRPNGDRLYSREIDWLAFSGSFYKGRPGEYQANVFTDFLSAEEVVARRDQVEQKVREELGIPYPQTVVQSIEHSIG